MNTINTIVKGKGIGGILNRFSSISGRYGFSPGKMDQFLDHFTELLYQYGVGGTFPITAVTLARNKIDLRKYQSKNIEFAIHGFFHTDYSQLSIDTQISHIQKSIQLFDELGIQCNGFRSPYLRWNEDTLSAVSGENLLYDSSQGLAWELNDGSNSSAYQRVLKFYRAESASIYPSTPRIENGLVQLPYSLPDDEALVERFQLNSTDKMFNIWSSILYETHRLGELFTLGIHPERFYLCEKPLREILDRALNMSPKVWIARLDEIAKWWNLLNQTKVTLEERDDQCFSFFADGPDGLVFVTRGVDVFAEEQNSFGGQCLVASSKLTVQSGIKPIIGISPSSSNQLRYFLRQHGYIFEIVDDDSSHSFFLNSPNFTREDERAILKKLENSKEPLVKIGRWPNGAKSALSITGDIDALTIWDYGLRVLGN